jgi:hypothetical protein
MEGVMMAAVMVPLAGLLLFGMIRICGLLYELAASLLSWPLL